MIMVKQEFLAHFNQKFHPEGKQLIFEFFLVFSRFEYALKSSGFSKGDENGISPNWDKFASSIRSTFIKTNSEDLNNAVEYLLNHPPKKQILTSSILAFKNRESIDNLDLVFKLKLYICDIRNNLFHGGKFDGEFEPEVSRNHTLLKHSLTILDNWLTLNEEVNYYFSLPIPD